MKRANAGMKRETMILVNKCDLEKIIQNDIIKNYSYDNNKPQIYVVVTEEKDLPKKISVVFIKNMQTNKISFSVNKIDELIKYKNRYGKHVKYEMKKMSIEKYLAKYPIPKESVDVNKVALDEVLVKVVKTMTSKNEKKDSSKIVTEYTDEENVVVKRYVSDYIMKAKRGDFDNKNLIISEIEGKIFLPYTLKEIEMYLKEKPEYYIDKADVISKEFILDYKIFTQNEDKRRFEETYKLIKNREKQNKFIAFIWAISMKYYKKLNPAVIAACKSKLELNNYLFFLQNNNLEEFEIFNIMYDMALEKSKEYN